MTGRELHASDGAVLRRRGRQGVPAARRARRRLRAEGRHVVAVIGDGAMTGGMAWKGLDDLSAARIGRSSSSSTTTGAPTPRRSAGWPITWRGCGTDPGRRRTDRTGQGAQPVREPRAGLPRPGRRARRRRGRVRVARSRADASPVVVHVVTEKGHGYRPAETDDADRMHGIGVLDPATGAPSTAPGRTWTEVFGDEILAVGEERPDVVCLSAAMVLPVGLGGFARRFPDRVFDVGIAEQQPSARRPAWPWAGCTRSCVCTRRSSTGRSTRCSWTSRCTGPVSRSCWTGPA